MTPDELDLGLGTEQPYQRGRAVITLILQMKNLRLRDVK